MATAQRPRPRSALENETEGGPPPGLPAKKLMILNDAEGKKTMAIAFFDSEEDYRQGDETLNSMSPPSGENTWASASPWRSSRWCWNWRSDLGSN